MIVANNSDRCSHETTKREEKLGIIDSSRVDNSGTKQVSGTIVRNARAGEKSSVSPRPRIL